MNATSLTSRLFGIASSRDRTSRLQRCTSIAARSGGTGGHAHERCVTTPPRAVVASSLGSNRSSSGCMLLVTSEAQRVASWIVTEGHLKAHARRGSPASLDRRCGSHSHADRHVRSILLYRLERRSAGRIFPNSNLAIDRSGPDNFAASYPELVQAICYTS